MMGALLLGVLSGTLYFGSLWCTIRLAVQNGGGRANMALSFLLRYLLLALLLSVAARAGVLSLLWCLFGIYLSRQFMLWSIGFTKRELLEDGGP